MILSCSKIVKVVVAWLAGVGVGVGVEMGRVAAMGRRYNLINCSYIVVHTCKKKQKITDCSTMTAKLFIILLILCS